MEHRAVKNICLGDSRQIEEVTTWAANRLPVLDTSVLKGASSDRTSGVVLVICPRGQLHMAMHCRIDETLFMGGSVI